MERELEVMLKEQQAILSLLMSRVALSVGRERRAAFGEASVLAAGPQ